MQGISIDNKKAAELKVHKSARLTFNLDSFGVAVLMGVYLLLLLQRL